MSLLSPCRPLRLMWLVVILLLATISTSVVGAPVAFSNRVVLTDDQGEYALGKHLLILEDPNKQAGLDDVLASTDRFVPSTREVPGYGFSKSDYWLRVELERHTTREQGWMLEFGYAPLQHIDLWTIAADGKTTHQSGGLAVRYAKRPYPHHKHVFELPLENGTVTQLLVRVDSESSINIPLRLYRADMFARASGNERAALGLYAGVLIGLLCYNLFIYYSIREPAYLFYAIFLGSFLVVIMALNGVAQPLFAPTSAWLGVRMIPFMMGVVGVSVGLFTMAFLNSRLTMPRLHKVMMVGVAWATIAMVLPWVASYRLAIICSAMLSLTFSTTLFVIAWVAVARGNYAARYYLLAWCVLLIGTILVSAKNFGLLPNNMLTEYSQLWGSAAESILLSVALAARMRIMKEETEKAQAAQFSTQQQLFAAQTETVAAQAATVAAQQDALKNKQVALDTVQKYSNRLETEVRKRTEELLQTQQKLVATEKMAALGVFTAGMAHEINNPANFVSVGAQNTAAQLEELRSFVTGLLADDPDEEIVTAFQSRFSRLEASNATVMEGVNRIQTVVHHLRATHPEGEAGFLPADVVSTLETAWKVVETTLGLPVSVMMEFPERPSLNCMIAELNQVFIALLTNAGMALQDAAIQNPSHRGRITLRSRVENSTLVLEVEDNGIGIPATHLDKIFDPFFTTREVGRGSGLGLSMARDIVQRHQGTVAAISTEGRGSCFRITLPLS